MAENITTLRFGAELELVLSPYTKFESFELSEAEKLECGDDKEKIYCQKLANIIQAAGVKAVRGDSEVAEQAKKAGTYYENWTVVKDPSIKPGDGECRYPISISLKAQAYKKRWCRDRLPCARLGGRLA